MRSFLLGSILIGLLYSFGCTSDVLCVNQQDGIVAPGPFGYCGYLIKLDDGSWLEPTNLGDFVDFESGLGNHIRVRVSFHGINSFSSCQVGKIVEIDCFSEL